MMDLPDLGALEQYARTSAALLDVLKKLRHALPRWKKGDKRALDKEVEAILAVLQQLMDLTAKHVSAHKTVVDTLLTLLRFMNSPSGVGQLLLSRELLVSTAATTKHLSDIAFSHENRLKVLEQRPEVRGTRVPKKKPRKPKRKRG